MKRRKSFIFSAIFAAFVCMILFSSCGTLGSIAQLGAGLGQALGLLDEKTADIINKSGVTAEAWGKAFEEITPEQEYYIGRAVGANVLAVYKLQTNKPALTTYVNKICNALVINSTRPEIYNGYHASVLDSDEINAFATPGGHIFITRGLIECAASEDMLAAVIAHEIAHIQLQHGLKAIKTSRFKQALGTTAGTIADGLNISELVDVFKNSVGEIANNMMNSGYSQKQELEADSVAMSFLSLAGYEPSSLIDLLGVLEKEQGSHKGGFNSTHPTPAQRITNAKRTVGKYDVADTRSYREARFAAAR